MPTPPPAAPPRSEGSLPAASPGAPRGALGLGPADAEAVLEAFFHHAPSLMGIVEITEDDDILHVSDNAATCAFFGVPAGATAGRLARELGATADTRAAWLRRYRESERTGGPVRFEYRYESPSGPAWLAVGVAPAGRAASGRPRFCYVAENITRQKEAEAALRQSEQRERERAEELETLMRELRSLTDNLPDVVARFDAGLRYVFVSAALERARGLAPSAALGHTDRELGVAPEMCARREAALRSVFASGQPLSFDTHEEHDGAVRHATSRLVPERGASGAVEHVLEIWRDETERWRREEDRERLLSALARSNEELERFAFVAGHDLKAPLRAIRNLAQWVAEDANATLPAESRGHLETIQARAARLDAMIDGLLQYARASRRAETLELVAPCELLRDCVDLLAPRRGVTVTVEGAASPQRVERAPFQQVFINLVGNALKHVPDSGGVVRILVEERPEHLYVRVADNGPGIAPDHHAVIWELFQTLDGAPARLGTGLGLALVRKTVEARGGAAWVESTGQGGAVFHVLWPRGEARPGDG